MLLITLKIIAILTFALFLYIIIFELLIEPRMFEKAIKAENELIKKELQNATTTPN